MAVNISGAGVLNTLYWEYTEDGVELEFDLSDGKAGMSLHWT